MAGLGQSNITLGREVELYQRVLYDDPAPSVLTAVVLASPCEPVAVLKQYDDLANLLGNNPEVTNTNYARIEMTDADLVAPVVEYAPVNRATLLLPLLTWDAGGGPDAGDAWDCLVICFDYNSGAGTDADLIPITFHELRYGGVALVPNGSPIVVDLTEGFVRARQGP